MYISYMDSSILSIVVYYICCTYGRRPKVRARPVETASRGASSRGKSPRVEKIRELPVVR